jgi:LAS superfamily LD-carboxypeptidase LdcB
MPFLLIVILLGVVLLMPKTATAYVGGKPVQITLGRIGEGHYLRQDAAKAFNAMVAAAAEVDVSIRVDGPSAAFRSPEQQAALKSSEPDLAANVNFSAHQAGIAVDITTNDGDGIGTNDAFMWLLSNAADYHFFQLPGIGAAKEPWHWEYHA